MDMAQKKRVMGTDMCEEKTSEQSESRDLASDGSSTNGDMSPSSTDSGHASAVSTPEAPLTPHEERSSTHKLSTDELVTYSNDTVYRIRIVAPNAEPFDLQVNAGEMVQELHQVLLERDSTSHRTCFSLQLDGVAMDHFTELKNIEGMKDGVVLKVVEEPYTIREARIHLRHVRDLMRSLDPSDGANGTDGASMSFVNVVTAASLDRRNRGTSASGSLDRSVDCTPPDYVLPGTKDPPLSHLQPQSKDSARSLQCVKSLSISGYNPPPNNRKLRGDILYLVVNTLENRRYHITCFTRGFCVNQSSDDNFNPLPANQKATYHSLVELLNHISPGFKRNFSIVQKKRSQKHIFERLPTPYQVYSWTGPSLDNPLDGIRAEDGTQPHRIGLEDHIPGQIRDWNEELQTTRELPRKTLPERLIRERAVFKIHSDFVAAAVKGAMAVVDGNVMAINPADDPRTHMYIWNNIFFSLGFDVKDHYQKLGGDAAAFIATANDLQGVRAYSTLDTEKLYTLGMVIVDYRGYRVTAQSIIPGILEREQEQSVVYGSVDFGKTVVSSTKYEELLEESAKQLKIYPHMVKSGKEDVSDVKLYSSFETKGIIGNDSRHYILDLLRTFPPDVNYLEGAEVTDICTANGYPRKFGHKLASLRQELIEAFVESRYVTFVRIAAYHLQQLRSSNQLQSEQDRGVKVEEVNEEKNEAVQGQVKDRVSERLSADSGVVSPSGDEHGNGIAPSTDRGSDYDHDGKRIAKEIKVEQLQDRMTAHCDRDPSPSCDADELIEPETAKRIVEESLSPSKPNANPSDDISTDIDKPQEIHISSEAATKQIIRKAALAVGSLSDTEFDIRFNPDCFCETVEHGNSEDMARQRRLVSEGAQFLLVHQIPNFIRDCLEHTLTPVDGAGLVDAMHSRGINVRYLGKIVDCLSDIPQLEYFKSVCMSELLVRSSKHIMRGYLQSVGQASLASALAHFFNCLLGSCPATQPSLTPEDLANMKRNKNGKKKSKGQSNTLAHDSLDWAQLTPKTLWQQISTEMNVYYGYSIENENCDTFVEQYALQKTSLLRRFCIAVGVQVLLKVPSLSWLFGVDAERDTDYNMDNKTRGPFTEEDIENVYPTVKHINPKARDAQNFMHTGQAKIQQGQLRAGFDLIAEALNLMNNVYGAMHPEIAQCMRLLARLAFILGDPGEALGQQHKATIMSERCCGVDSPQTIVEYMNLAHFSFANLQISTSLKLLYRARYLLIVCHGENHPIMAQIDSNIGVVLYAVQEYDFALKFLQHALKLHMVYAGANSLKTALIYHLIARAHSCRGDFRTALQHEKEAFTIYSKTFGDDHEKTKESGECLRHLTQQAVTFQKRMNEAKQGGSISQLLPLQIQQPSLQNVLEVLNILNGIIFIQLSSGKDSEDEKAEESAGNEAKPKQPVKQLQMVDDSELD